LYSFIWFAASIVVIGAMNDYASESGGKCRAIGARVVRTMMWHLADRRNLLAG
jgi:hypothetical protein